MTNRPRRAAGSRMRLRPGARVRIAATGLLVCSWPALAGRPDYSHLSDTQLQHSVFAISCWLAAMALLGLYGWWRYLRSYRPGPGRFTPRQALLAVVAVIAVVTALALRKLGLT